MFDKCLVNSCWNSLMCTSKPSTKQTKAINSRQTQTGKLKTYEKSIICMPFSSSGIAIRFLCTVNSVVLDYYQLICVLISEIDTVILISWGA